jgi:hypothetical protein
MPDGTNSNSRVFNACAPAEQRPNKTPIYITGFNNTRAFLAWLRAQLKAEKLMVVPSTADGFRATVSALPCLDKREGVSFHTFSLLEERCMRLLVNLASGYRRALSVRSLNP